MMREMVAALPPLKDSRVLDLLSGAGQAATAVLEAYPRARVTALDKSRERLEQARLILQSKGLSLEKEIVLEVDLASDEWIVPEGPFNLVLRHFNVLQWLIKN